MNYKTALYVSYVLIVVSLCTLAFRGLEVAKLVPQLPAGPDRILSMISLVWPLAFYAAAVYRRKIAQDAVNGGKG